MFILYESTEYLYTFFEIVNKIMSREEKRQRAES